MELLAYSWREIKRKTIENWFKKCGFVLNSDQISHESNSNDSNETILNENSEESVLNLEEDIWNIYTERAGINGITFDDYLNVDENLETSENIDESSIIGNLLNQNSANIDLFNESTDEELPAPQQFKESVTFSEAVEALDVLKHFIWSNNFKDSTSENLHSIENEILDFNVFKSNVQTRITDFLK